MREELNLMTTDKGAPAPSTLRDLLARVEAATGPNEQIDRAINDVFRLFSDEDVWNSLAFRTDELRHASWRAPFTSSLDAAVALMVLQLPGNGWSMDRSVWGGKVTYWVRMAGHSYDAPTFALALLKAMLTTLIDQEEIAA